MFFALLLASQLEKTLSDKLRRLMNLGQLVQSHALSFFHLSSPDFLLGWDAPQPKRNVFGLIAANADLARAGIRLRQFGQEIIEILGGKKIHPAWAVPGGVRSPLTEEGRARIRAWLHDEVILEPIRIAVKNKIDAGINTPIPDLSALVNVGDPSLRILSCEVVAVSSQRLFGSGGRGGIGMVPGYAIIGGNQNTTAGSI